MDKIIKWQGSTRCDLCGNEVKDKIFDTRTVFGSWANTCSSCNSIYGAGNSEPFVWSPEHKAFIKKKHVADEALFLAENLGITDDEAMNMLEDFGM